MDMELAGKAAIVTGGGATLGRQISLALAAEGARVAVADINEEQSRRVANQIVEGGGEAFSVKTDVSDEGQVQAMVGQVVQKFGTVDVLVNNAGIVGPQGPWSELSPDGFDSVVGVNLKGTYLCSKTVSGHMTAQQSGRIVNIASIAGKTGEIYNGLYSATKSAVISLTQSLALELAKASITVNAVCPAGIKDSEIMKTVYTQRAKWFEMTPEALRKEWRAAIPLPYEVTVEDLANTVVFLASDKARNITGEAVNVTGGVEVH